MTSSAEPAPSAYGGPRLRRGEFARVGQSLTSASGRCTLTSLFRPTLYDNATGAVLWVAPVPDHPEPGARFALGLDGELVLSDRFRSVLWTAGTAGRGVQTLEVRDRGEVVLLDAAGVTVWTTGTAVDPAGTAWPSPGRAAVLRRGQSLRRQSLTSDDGRTLLSHSDHSVYLHDPDQRQAWSRGFTAENSFLELDLGGRLRGRGGDGSILYDLGGPGEELVVANGRAELRDAAGTVVWTTTRDGQPDVQPPPTGPDQARLEVWIDSLTAGRGHTATIVLDVEPAEALRRRGLPDGSVRAGTWVRLRAERDATGSAAVVAAVALGRHTLVLTDAPGLSGAALSAGTTAITSTWTPGRHRRPGRSEWTLHRDGATLVHLRSHPPKRRKGARLPELVRALDPAGADPLWAVDVEGLALLCRVAGVAPTAADLGDELLGGLLDVVEPDERSPEPPPPVRAPLTVPDLAFFPVVMVRTDYSDDDAWAEVVDSAQQNEWREPVIHAVSDPVWAGADPEEVLAALPPDRPGVVFVADQAAMNPFGYPVLAISTTIPAPSADYEPADGEQRTFRAEAETVSDVAGQLAIGNLGFADLVDQAGRDPEGVFRG